MTHQITHFAIASMFALGVVFSHYAFPVQSIRWCGRFALLMLVIMAVPNPPPSYDSRLNIAQDKVLKELANRIVNYGRH